MRCLHSYRQAGEAFDPIIKFIAKKGHEAAQSKGTLTAADVEFALKEGLQKVDKYGVEGSSPVNEQEVISVQIKAASHTTDPVSANYVGTRLGVSFAGSQDRQKAVAMP